MNTDNRVEEAAVRISENIQPPLTAKEQAFFVAGFQECIKWQKQQPLGLRDEEIKQEFKELSIYLDDIYCQHLNNTKDAGHLWIAFIDKFNAFKNKLLQPSTPAPVNFSEAESAAEILNKVMSKYPHEATKGYRYLSDWIIEAMKAYKNQSLPAPVEGEGDKPVTEEEKKFMMECNMYPTYYLNELRGVTIMTEDSEGALLDPDDLLKLADILKRYAK